MTTTSYSPPISQLLTLGIDEIEDQQSPTELGITAADVPELIRMAADEALYTNEDETASWAPLYAWRLLGELGGEAAIAPLLQVLQRWGEDASWWEWVLDELPLCFSNIGPVAIPALEAAFADETRTDPFKEKVSEILVEMTRNHPEVRADCVAVLTRQLEQPNKHSPTVNGYIVAGLAGDLKAVESAAVIEQAYQANRVSDEFVGDWDDVQVYLGLKEPEDMPFRNFPEAIESFSRSESYGFRGHQAGSKAKSKQKAQKLARRKSRKKKKK